MITVFASLGLGIPGVALGVKRIGLGLRVYG